LSVAKTRTSQDVICDLSVDVSSVFLLCFENGGYAIVDKVVRCSRVRVFATPSPADLRRAFRGSKKPLRI